MTMERELGEFITLSRSDPGQAVEQVSSFLDLIDSQDHGTRSAVYRHAALAARSIRDLKRSESFLDLALSEAEGLAAPSHRTRALLTRSYNTFLLGKPDEALALVASLDGGEDVGLTTTIKLQQATILGRVGKTAEAIRSLDAAEHIGRGGDPFILSQVLKNRGLFEARDGRYNEAIADLEAARAYCLELENDFEVAFCDHNLGLAASFSGDLPTAFAQFESAEARIRQLAGSDFESKASHCRALIFGGLFQEAAAMAGAAALQCEEADFISDAAELRMLEAVSWLEVGDLDRAEDRARLARTAFTEQERTGWAAAAEIVIAAIRHRSGRAINLGELEDQVEQLEVLGLRRDAIEGRLLLVEALADSGRNDDAEAMLSALAGDIESSTTDLRLAAATAEATLSVNKRDRPRALSVATSGYELLAEQQALIGGSDLRIGIRQHGERLGQIGLSQALLGDAPSEVLDWFERIDLTTNTPRPIRPHQDPAIRRSLTRLRALETDQLDERRTLEDSVRTMERARRGTTNPIFAKSAADLSDALGSTSAISYCENHGQLIACRLHGGETQVYELGDAEAVFRVARAVRAAMRRRTVRSKPSDTSRPLALLAKLDELLLAPLAVGEDPTVIAPAARLFAIPWNALPSRRSMPTSVATSLTAWSTTSRSHAHSRPVLIGGADLDHAVDEVAAIDRAAKGATTLFGAAATSAEALRVMEGGSLAHIVAHGTVRSDNPLFSSLRMADGELSVYELGDLQQAPSVVVLSACHVGLAAEAPGQELLGMVTGFLNAGTSCVVASTLPVPDSQSTIDMMSRFHRFLGQGMSPAVAWAEVQRTCTDDEQLLDTATFTVFGRG